jgi:hypothetical protein
MLSAGSARREVRQRRPDRVEREIGHNAEPADERVAGTEAGSAEAVGQRLGLEVDRRPHELRRRGYPECVEARALPLLSRGMVDLEHAHIPGLTPRERVEARAEDHVLARPRRGQPVLAESRARGHPRRKQRRAVAEHRP